MRDRAVEQVDAADAYQQEGQMTTFFRTDNARHGRLVEHPGGQLPHGGDR